MNRDLMTKQPVPELDDDFSDIYKEYTGPPGSTGTTVQEKAKSNKRPHDSSDEEGEPRDPNAVPTDFTSREAKVWEAKSKATEKLEEKKEEEMICKLCGESGHFTQGCPSTLGANRKSQDFFERVPAREKHVKALFTEKVIDKIENDVGCKIKVEKKFLIVSGKDRLCLAKGVDALQKTIREAGNKKGSYGSYMNRARSPERSPVGSRMGRSESQRSFPSPRNALQFHQKFSRQEKVVEDRVREDLQHLLRGSPQARVDLHLTYSSFDEAYGSEGFRSRSSHLKSPACSKFAGNTLNSYDGPAQSIGVYKDDLWDTESHRPDRESGHKFEYPAYPKTLEELELEYKREALELGQFHDKYEDEENYKHREAVREMRVNFMKKRTILWGKHVKMWEEFVQLSIQRQQRAFQQMSVSGFIGYDHPGYSDYGQSFGSRHHEGSNLHIDSRGRYPHPLENYPISRPHDGDGAGTHGFWES